MTQINSLYRLHIPYLFLYRPTSSAWAYLIPFHNVTICWNCELFISNFV